MEKLAGHWKELCGELEEEVNEASGEIMELEARCAALVEEGLAMGQTSRQAQAAVAHAEAEAETSRAARAKAEEEHEHPTAPIRPPDCTNPTTLTGNYGLGPCRQGRSNRRA